jgi:hypothetical protein
LGLLAKVLMALSRALKDIVPMYCVLSVHIPLRCKKSETYLLSLPSLMLTYLAQDPHPVVGISRLQVTAVWQLTWPETACR